MYKKRKKDEEQIFEHFQFFFFGFVLRWQQQQTVMDKDNGFENVFGDTKRICPAIQFRTWRGNPIK